METTIDDTIKHSRIYGKSDWPRPIYTRAMMMKTNRLQRNIRIAVDRCHLSDVELTVV